MSDRVSAFVFRDSVDETTFAVVSCNRSKRVGSSRQLFRQLTLAVTNWVNRTETGRAAWESSSCDYNVGDLSTDLGEPTLLARLRARGITALEVEIYSDDDVYDSWTYDTVLVEEPV